MTTKSAGRRDLLDRLIRAHRPTQLIASLHYNHMIECVRANSSLLSPRSFRHRSRKQQHRDTGKCIRAIARMARFSDRMVRSPHAWIPQGDPIHSLSKHLFAKFDVPEFAHRAWFGEMTEVKILLDMARGVSPRKAVANSGLNSRLTRKAAHCFANAPDRFGVANTIRWAQAVAFGASDSLATQIVIACDGFDYEEPFWQELVRFLIYASNVTPEGRERSIIAPDSTEMREIANFVWRQKYVGASEVLGYRVHDNVPLQPEFSFRGRTLRAFRRHMRNWRTEIDIPISTPIEIAMRNRVWSPSGIQQFSISDGDFTWKMVEILDSVQLRCEGGLMQHCVAVYESSCRSGRCSIWSLRKCVDQKERRIVTVEVWPESRRIVQAKAKRNADPTPHSMALIRRWAQYNSLEIQ